MHDQFKLRHLCNISPPLTTPKVDTATCKERRSIIQAQMKITEEFQNEYLKDLYDLILEYAEVISWNGEPGRTTLGETSKVLKLYWAYKFTMKHRRFMSPNFAAGALKLMRAGQNLLHKSPLKNGKVHFSVFFH